MGRKMHFFHSSRHFRKLKHCMVNNRDKSKLFCWNYFHVGGVPNFTMSAYEPNHHSVPCMLLHNSDAVNTAVLFILLCLCLIRHNCIFFEQEATVAWWMFLQTPVINMLIKRCYWNLHLQPQTANFTKKI